MHDIVFVILLLATLWIGIVMGAMGVIIFKKENSLDYIVETWRKKEVLLPERMYYTAHGTKQHLSPHCETLAECTAVYSKPVCKICLRDWKSLEVSLT